jgi:hypothetical protein
MAGVSEQNRLKKPATAGVCPYGAISCPADIGGCFDFFLHHSPLKQVSFFGKRG